MRTTLERSNHIRREAHSVILSMTTRTIGVAFASWQLGLWLTYLFTQLTFKMRSLSHIPNDVYFHNGFITYYTRCNFMYTLCRGQHRDDFPSNHL